MGPLKRKRTRPQTHLARAPASLVTPETSPEMQNSDGTPRQHRVPSPPMLHQATSEKQQSYSSSSSIVTPGLPSPAPEAARPRPTTLNAPAARAPEIKLQPPVPATTGWRPPLQIGAPLGFNISRLERAERELLQWEAIYNHVLETQPEAARTIEQAVWAARRKRDAIVERGDTRSAEAEFEQVKKARIRARVDELWAATAVTRNSDEANNMLAAIRGYESGQIPYSDQWHLIYGGHLVDACPSYQSFTVDRHQRLDRYAASHGEGWLWYEPPLSTAMDGEVWGASSSSSERVVQGVAYAGTKLDARDNHWGLGCHYMTMGFKRVKTRVYRSKRHRHRTRAGGCDGNTCAEGCEALQQRRRSSSPPSSSSSSSSPSPYSCRGAKRIKKENDLDGPAPAHMSRHRHQNNINSRIRDRDPTAPLLGFSVLWDTGATFACLRESDFEALGLDPAMYAAQSYTSIRTVNGVISRPVYDMHSEVMGADDDDDDSHAHTQKQKHKLHRPLVDPGAPVWPGEEPMLGGIVPVVKLEQLHGDAAQPERLSGILPNKTCYMASAPGCEAVYLGEDRRDVLGAVRMPGQLRYEFPRPLLTPGDTAAERRRIDKDGQVVFRHLLKRGRGFVVDSDVHARRGASVVTVNDDDAAVPAGGPTRSYLLEPRTMPGQSLGEGRDRGVEVHWA